jgi:hypothetical protein
MVVTYATSYAINQPISLEAATMSPFEHPDRGAMPWIQIQGPMIDPALTRATFTYQSCAYSRAGFFR